LVQKDILETKTLGIKIMKAEELKEALLSAVATICEEYAEDKLEEPKFKIGDWIVYEDGSIGIVSELWLRYEDKEGNFKLWQPTENEWVCEWSHTESEELNVFKWNGITGTSELIPLKFAQTLKDK